jgi:hypothetical protein
MSYDNFDQHSGYENQWFTRRGTKSSRASDLWSVPESHAVSEDPDCDYEEDQSCVYQNQAPIDGVNHDPVQDGYCASGVHYDDGSTQDGASKPQGNNILAVCTQYVSWLTLKTAPAPADTSSSLHDRVE